MEKKKGSAGDTIVGLLVVVGVIWAVVKCSSPSEQEIQARAKADAETKAAEEVSCRQDLACLGDKGTIAAGIYCKDRVEKLARGAVNWTDGTLEQKFTRFRWKDKSASVITYIGDRAQFQNGFGAYLNVIYECDMSIDRQTILDVRVSEGRLPS